MESKDLTKLIKYFKQEKEKKILELIIHFLPMFDKVEDSPINEDIKKICSIYNIIEDLKKQRQRITQKKYKNSHKGKIKCREASLRYYHRNKDRPPE